MHKRYIIRRTSLFLLSLFLAVTAVRANDLTDVTDTIKKSFKVEPGGTLFLDIDHGNIIIETIREDAVYIEVERKVNTDERAEAQQIFDEHEVSFNQRRSDIRIESRFDRDSGLWRRVRNYARFRVQITVQVPERYNVDFRSGAGNVEIEDLTGEVLGRTGAGNIMIGGITGEIEITSGSGTITIEAAEGRVEASTGAGNIEVRNAHGDVDIHTGAGNITAYITEQPRDESRLVSGAGNVTVYLEDNIRVDVDAEASVGSASTDFPLEIEGRWMRKSFGGRINGGGPELNLRAGVGNVSLKKM